MGFRLVTNSNNLPILYCNLSLIDGIGNNTVGETPVELWGECLCENPPQFYTNGKEKEITHKKN